MPNYRNENDEYRRRPKMKFDREYEPEWDDEEEDMVEDRKFMKKPCFCKIECPFKVLVKIVPCDDRRRHMPM